MELVKVDDSNVHVYANLIQAYEAEFSRITHKEPDIDGLYAMDTVLGDKIDGYILFDDGTPIGVSALKNARCYEVCEFYVIPTRRRQGIGQLFAKMIWQLFAGVWEVKQIKGADDARLFWRAAISDFTNGAYAEDIYDDPYWGRVTRQVFMSK